MVWLQNAKECQKNEIRKSLFTFCLIKWENQKTPVWILDICWGLTQGTCWSQKKWKKKKIRSWSKWPKTENVNKLIAPPGGKIQKNYKIENLVFGQIYHPSNFQPCRLTLKEMRAFSNFPEKQPNLGRNHKIGSSRWTRPPRNLIFGFLDSPGS